MICTTYHRSGLKLVEVLILIGILSILVGLALPGLYKVRSSSDRARCASRLHNMGVALHNAHNDFDHFPMDDDCSTFFTKLLPYLEEKPLYRVIMSGGAPLEIKTFRCDERVSRRGPKTDFAVGFHPTAVYGGDDDWRSIQATMPDFIGPKKTKLSELSSKDGSSNTLHIAIKGMRPADYATGGENDEGWASLGTPFDHQRDPRYTKLDSDAEDMKLYLGSQFPGTMPTLWGDGAVKGIRYNIKPEVGARLWSWNDGINVPSNEYE